MKGFLMDSGLITSKELLSKTDISRATLNNYIKYGILPRPVVRSTPGSTEGPTKIGYFPSWVLDRILIVQQMKREGKTMGEIMLKLRDGTGGAEQSLKTDDRAGTSPADDRRIPSEKTDFAYGIDSVCLDVENLQCAAYFINQDFEIEWINDAAGREFFNQSVSSIRGNEDRNIFKRLFGWEFHDFIENWQDFIRFQMGFAKRFLHRDAVSKLYHGMTAGERECLERAYDETSQITAKGVVERPLKIRRKNGEELTYSVYTVFFREGLFFVFDPESTISNDLKAILSRREELIQDLLTHRMPSLLSLCVLVADLQDSVKISVELPPSEYFELINGLWQSVADIFDGYKGICGKHAGDGLLYYFIKKPGSNHIMDALNCAMKVRERVKSLSNDWKVRKGWFNELYMNIGIDEGKEFFGTIQSAYNLEFAALGDSINHAARLSNIARRGSVLTTKNLINKLSSEEQQSVNYGVRRQHPEAGEVFIEKSFSRVFDLLGPDLGGQHKFMDIGTLPVTEIVSISQFPSGNGPLP